MPLRALNLSLTTLTLLAIGVPILGQPSAPTTSLRVESLSRYPIQVRMTLKVLPTPGAMLVQRAVVDSVFKPPAIFDIADSIRTIHLVVKGFGSIRAALHNSAGADSTPVIAQGRDLTFAGDGEGHFKRVWTAQPLIP